MSLHIQDLPPRRGQRPQKSLMLDKDGKLKYPPKVRRVEVKETEVTQIKELPPPGIVRLRVSFIFASHKYLNSLLFLCYNRM
jgi:hypothetical protein